MLYVREEIMKLLFALFSLAVLSGCAYAPPTQYGQASRYAPPPADPSQWHVVSVTPVPPGTGASVQYSSEPVPRTVYVPQPLYAPPAYYYPPASIGLDFMLGRSWGRYGRNFGGVGIGSRWGR